MGTGLALAVATLRLRRRAAALATRPPPALDGVGQRGDSNSRHSPPFSLGGRNKRSPRRQYSMPSLDQEISVQPRKSGVGKPALALALRASASVGCCATGRRGHGRLILAAVQPWPAGSTAAGQALHPVAAGAAGQFKSAWISRFDQPTTRLLGSNSDLQHFLQLRPRLPGVPTLRPITRRGQRLDGRRKPRVESPQQTLWPKP